MSTLLIFLRSKKKLEASDSLLSNTKVTKYRRLPENTPSYIGTDRGTQASTYYPQVVKQAVIDYIENQED